MRRHRLNSRTLTLSLAVVALVALAAIACNGEESSPASGTPAAVTPGSGIQPIEAIGSYINAGRLEGYELDFTEPADCPLKEVIATPGVVSRLTLGQFCLTSKDVVPEKSMTIIVEMPETGEKWDMKLEFDSEDSLWKIKEVVKTAG